MPKPTGYKATRKSIAQVREEHRKRVWANSGVPPGWEIGVADKELMRLMLEKNQDPGSDSEKG